MAELYNIDSASKGIVVKPQTFTLADPEVASAVVYPPFTIIEGLYD